MSSTPTSSGTAPSMPPSSRFNRIVFYSLLAVFCLWALSLPLFPTQDGPLHKYYVHVIASLVSGQHFYDAYQIRRPLPPYAIHYLVLFGLSKVVSIDLAEKFFICLIFVATACGFRYCARSLGPSGDSISLCAVPLVLSWPVVMGFLNYSLAIGLFLFAVGFWLRAADGRPRLWLPFVILVAILTLTHPVPLLLLIVFCALDLVRAVFWDQGVSRQARGLKGRWLALGAACLAFLYPLASADRSRSASNIAQIGFHKSAFAATLALAGLSPFDTRARNFSIDLYRLGLYAALIAGLTLAAAGIGARWRSRRLRSGDVLFAASIFLLVAIPFLPEAMNGSDWFARRLLIFPWLGALAAAAGYARSEHLKCVVPAFVIALSALVLLPAEHFFRPAARQLADLEAQPLPPHAQGLAILDGAMLQSVRTNRQLGFNPYLWGTVLPFIHNDDLMLNSPWLDLTIMPLKAAPGSPLFVNAMASPEEEEKVINGNIDLAKMPDGLRNPLLDATHLIVYVAVPADVQRGLPSLAGNAEAARFSCAPHGWYLICTR